MRPATAPGRYSVEFTAQSADQHPVAGTISFDVIASPEPASSPAAEPAQSPDDTPLWLWVSGAGAVLVASAAAARLIVRRRNPPR